MAREMKEAKEVAVAVEQMTAWGRQEFREIRFEICYAVHFSVARNFVRN